MDKTLKSACFDEITHLICDADKKVNISDVSNNWNISHRDSETVLLEWIETNKKQTLNKEFLIRGVDKSGNCVITVLPENKLDDVQKKFEKFCYSLYSVELASKSNAKRLNVAKLNECKWINLPSKHFERDIVVKPLPIESVKHVEEPATSKKGIKSMFSASSSGKKPEVKQEIETVDIKAEKETPKKQSPKKKESVKTPKMASGKASISSFFSKPSSEVVNTKKKESTQPVKKEHPKEESKEKSNMFDDQSSMDVDQSEEVSMDTKAESKGKKRTAAKNNKKRSIVDVDDGGSDEMIPGTPQERKKAKKINKKTVEKSKHTRIVKMADSSDDDDNHDAELKLLASPVKEKENKTPPKVDKATEKGKRRKAKKKLFHGHLQTKKDF